MTAAALATGQRCPRRYKLEREYRVLREAPKAVLERLLRQAIFAISNGAVPAKEAEEASTALLEQAAHPGLDIATDPYTLCRDFCAIIHNVCEAASRLTLLTLHAPPPTNDWIPCNFVDESGLLHRWIVCERWDADTQYRELHSWSVFGDCAALETGMWLHAIEIGRQSKGHQHSGWCRAFKHPAIYNHFRFRKVDGSPLEPSWKPVWFQDSDRNEPKVWVDLMEADKLDLIKHVMVKEPAAPHVTQFHRELATESARLAALPAWREIPMYRPACDLPPCPWQGVCYGRPGAPVEACGGYVKITGEPVENMRILKS